MNSSQQPLKTTATDLRDVLTFWEMKDEILADLERYVVTISPFKSNGRYDAVCERIDKIESLGKKEDE